MNDSLNKLLDLGLEDIRIWKLYNGTIGLAYNNSYVTSGDWLTGAFGCGNTIEEAADDYVNKINNKKGRKICEKSKQSNCNPYGGSHDADHYSDGSNCERFGNS